MRGKFRLTPVLDRVGWNMKPRANIKIYNEDCLPAMRQMKDNEFDLAIVDPPYGIGKNWNKDTLSKFYKHKSTYKNDKPPDENYFKQLFRVSKYQIIWSANYYWQYLNPTTNIIWWDKMIDPIKHKRSAGELGWTNITKLPANQFTFSWNGCATSEPRYGFHPHEKPVALYKWLLKNYAKPGDRILDTHLGGGSITIACWDMGFDLVGYEIDKDYYEAAMKRFKNHTAQLQLDLAV